MQPENLIDFDVPATCNENLIDFNVPAICNENLIDFNIPDDLINCLAIDVPTDDDLIIDVSAGDIPTDNDLIINVSTGGNTLINIPTDDDLIEVPADYDIGIAARIRAAEIVYLASIRAAANRNLRFSRGGYYRRGRCPRSSQQRCQCGRVRGVYCQHILHEVLAAPPHACTNLKI